MNKNSSEDIPSIQNFSLYRKWEERLGAFSVFLAYLLMSVAMIKRKHRDPDIANLSYTLLWIAICRRSLRKDTEARLIKAQSKLKSFFSGRKKVMLLCGIISIPSILVAQNPAEQIGRCIFFLFAGLLFSLDVPSRVKSHFEKTGQFRQHSNLGWIITVALILGLIVSPFFK